MPGSAIPNNTYGWGRIDALAAYSSLKLATSLELSSPEIEPTGVLTFTFQVTNLDSSQLATQVVLTSTLPGGSELVSASQPYTLTGDTLEWSTASLDPLAVFSVQLAIQVLPNAAGTLVNHYAATSQELLPNVVQPAPIEVPIVPRSLMVSKLTPSSLVRPGELLTYTLTVTNPNPTLAESSLILSDTLPFGTEMMSASEPYSFDGQTVTWELVALPAGDEWHTLLETRVLPGTQGSISNVTYGAGSQAVLAQHGMPVIVQVLSSTFYLPSLLSNGLLP